MWRRGRGVEGRFCVDRFSFFELAVGSFDLGFPDEVLLDLLDCGWVSLWVCLCAEALPFRRWVPSGRLAGPTEKPFLGLFACAFESWSSASAKVLLGAMLARSEKAPRVGWRMRNRDASDGNSLLLAPWHSVPLSLGRGRGHAEGL